MPRTETDAEIKLRSFHKIVVNNQQQYISYSRSLHPQLDDKKQSKAAASHATQSFPSN
jgi:hypothetical protein